MNEIKIPAISSDKAWEILERDVQAVLLDVRTTMEYHYVGHPQNAVHVAWQEPPKWRVNPHFVGEVHSLLRRRKDTDNPEYATLLVMCRSGKRSHDAALLLAESGFSRLYNIIDGFEGDLDEAGHRNTINGWRCAGLPWTQS